CQQGYLYPRTF
nr:immunoglobulin light chain junction region [Macaca mulatta]